MTAPESSTDLLRRAAKHLDDLAAATTGEHWEATENHPEAWEVWTQGARHAIAQESGHGDIPEADARWMATLGPQVADPLSAWLRNAADYAEQIGSDFRAVRVARAILGETGEAT